MSKAPFIPAFTQESLNALEHAIVEGAKSVRYSDKEIEYRSLDEMLKIRDIVKREIGTKKCSSNRKGLFGGARIRAEYDKDLF